MAPQASPSRPVVPIFVLGVPRSGTTLIGAYLATSSSVLHLGEFGGFYLAFGVGPQLCVADRLSGKPLSPLATQFLAEIQQHALEFPAAAAAGRDVAFWCDSSPANLMVVEHLEAHLRKALYVLMIRRHQGVLPSLARCFERGEFWAGATWEQRAELWMRFYENARSLPKDRTIALSYDMLCRFPELALEGFRHDLARFGLPVDSLDDAALATSWATRPDDRRPTIARQGDDGTLSFCPGKASDRVPWSDETDQRILAIVERTRQFLRESFPGIAPYL